MSGTNSQRLQINQWGKNNSCFGTSIFLLTGTNFSKISNSLSPKLEAYILGQSFQTKESGIGPVTLKNQGIIIFIAEDIDYVISNSECFWNQKVLSIPVSDSKQMGQTSAEILKIFKNNLVGIFNWAMAADFSEINLIANLIPTIKAYCATPKNGFTGNTGYSVLEWFYHSVYYQKGAITLCGFVENPKNKNPKGNTLYNSYQQFCKNPVGVKEFKAMLQNEVNKDIFKNKGVVRKKTTHGISLTNLTLEISSNSFKLNSDSIYVLNYLKNLEVYTSLVEDQGILTIKPFLLNDNSELLR